MKVGMIFECGPEGADRKVCEYLAKKIDPNIEIESVTLDNKKNLVSECGRASFQLLASGCDRVVIMWDLHPSWRETAPCRKEDREDIMRSLVVSKVDMSKMFLVCIEEELEAWLLADNRAIEVVLSKPHRPVRINRERHPEQVNNPKKRLMQIFHQEGRRPYNDLIDAEKIVKAMPDLSRLTRVETFVRFALKVADKRF
jgi:hypothetical protein